ncbi:MAG: hypothetical protein TYPL_0260 [Candidatus Tyloplasma litorale]|nr:MAG: hypothetical protein TYPL_0260 [Mycoplasmatales bacterium]
MNNDIENNSKELKNKKERYKIINKKGIGEFLKDIKYPIYFLDFEAISEKKDWMLKHNLPLDQQISSFSILKINTKRDINENKIKHFNFVGKKEDYKLMAKKLSDFYKNKPGTVVVWDRILENNALIKLMKNATKDDEVVISEMLKSIIDLQRLFIDKTFISVNKVSLDFVSKAFSIYEDGGIKDGRKAHYILADAEINKEKYTSKKLNNTSKRIEKYNNSDVINIKRVLFEILKIINKKEKAN